MKQLDSRLRFFNNRYYDLILGSSYHKPGYEDLIRIDFVDIQLLVSEFRYDLWY